MKHNLLWLLVLLHTFLFFPEDLSAQNKAANNISAEELLLNLIEHPTDSILNISSNERLAYINAFRTSLEYVARDKKRLTDLSAKLQYFIKNEKNKVLKVYAKYLDFNVSAASGISVEARIPMLTAIKKDAQEAKEDMMLMEVNMDLGTIYTYHKKEYEKGFLLFRENLASMEKSSTNQHPLHVSTACYLTNLFLLVKDWNNALVYARKGLQLKNTVFDNDGKLFLLQSIGRIYHNLNMHDSSDYYFNKLLISAREAKDSLRITNAYGYLGENYMQKKEYFKALPLIEMQKKYSVQTGDYVMIAIDLLLEAEIYFKLGKIEKFKALINESEKYVYASERDNVYKSFYTQKVKLSFLSGGKGKGLIFLDSLLFFSEKISRSMDAVKGLKAEQLYSLDLVEKKAAVEQITKKKTADRNVFLAIIILLTSLFILLLYQNRQNKLRLQLLLEKQLLRNELTSVQYELSEFLAKIDVKAKEIMHWNETRITTPEEWNHFMELFSKTNPGFIQKVKDTLVGITPAELRFLCLSKIKITDNQMAIILGINPNSVRQTRKRVKEKFGFETNESMLEFIDSL